MQIGLLVRGSVRLKLDSIKDNVHSACAFVRVRQTGKLAESLLSFHLSHAIHQGGNEGSAVADCIHVGCACCSQHRVVRRPLYRPCCWVTRPKQGYQSKTKRLLIPESFQPAVQATAAPTALLSSRCLTLTDCVHQLIFFQDGAVPAASGPCSGGRPTATAPEDDRPHAHRHHQQLPAGSAAAQAGAHTGCQPQGRPG